MRLRHFTARARLPVLLLVACGATACDDPFGDLLRDVPEVPTEVVLFDFETGRLEDPPAFDILTETVARVDQTSNWDFLFRVRDGVPELVPFTVATDSVTDAGFIVSTTPFEGILEAPDGGYQVATPLPISAGDVLIARSRANPAQSLLCSRYAKLEILEIDLATGTLTFHHLVNPNCGDVVLEPGTHGDP